MASSRSSLSSPELSCVFQNNKTWYVAASPPRRDGLTPTTEQAQHWCAANTVRVAEDGRSLVLGGGREFRVVSANDATSSLRLSGPAPTPAHPTSMGLAQVLTCKPNTATLMVCDAGQPQNCTEVQLVDSIERCAKVYI